MRTFLKLALVALPPVLFVVFCSPIRAFVELLADFFAVLTVTLILPVVIWKFLFKTEGWAEAAGSTLLFFFVGTHVLILADWLYKVSPETVFNLIPCLLLGVLFVLGLSGLNHLAKNWELSRH